MAYYYEQPFGTRKTVNAILIIAYITILIIQSLSIKDKIKYILMICLILILITLEFNSKYAINYFIHSMYIVLLIYVILYYDKKPSFFLSGLLSFAAIVKFIELLLIQPTQANIAISLFYTVIQILILLVVILAKGYKDENYKTKLLYEELLNTHKQIKQLATMEERTKIARDLHDTLGHDMTGLIMQIEMSHRYLLNNQIEKGISTLEKAKISSRESLTKVRQILNTLKTENDLNLINDSIKDMIEEFAKKTNIDINLKIEGNRKSNPDIEITIYRIIQESLTNSIRHGNATNVIINLDYQDKYISFYIKDNGTGCKQLIKGNGLQGIIERVETIGGEVSFENKNGFITKGNLFF